MAVILKKDEKIGAVVNSLQTGYSFEDFIDRFKELYMSDWKKIEANYFEHIKRTKPGKPVPMPKPEQYLKNALNVWLKKSN